MSVWGCSHKHGSQQIYDIIIYIYLLQRGSHTAMVITTTGSQYECVYIINQKGKLGFPVAEAKMSLKRY